MRSNFILRVVQKIPGFHLVEYVDFEDFVVIINPKVGSRTVLLERIRLAGGDITRPEEYDKHTHFTTKSKFVDMSKKRPVYGFVRDPFARLHSCWKQKLYHEDSAFRLFGQYFIMYWPYLRHNMSFENFINNVIKIPDFLSEKHFMSQSRLLLINKASYKAIVPIEQMGIVFNEWRRLNSNIREPEHQNRTEALDYSTLNYIDLKRLIDNKYADDLNLYRT